MISNWQKNYLKYKQLSSMLNRVVGMKQNCDNKKYRIIKNIYLIMLTKDN
ncbi:hypothetical protein HMPREF9098_2257 [Kingella denitrificans ATCC 33394]|uniref:Uncharacterized protein n=1 Tax=Kingella denitrificans ATCC 33394 TaxID=888741 RepID=F0F2C2_9NEIS|nr:hypothetical protein HMPREF9098_2257 [Kingella denitrificans ATCC 33394]